MVWDIALGITGTATAALLYALFRAPTLAPDDVRGLSDDEIRERDLVAHHGAEIIRLFRSERSSS